jgi:hypothetical protein
MIRFAYKRKVLQFDNFNLSRLSWVRGINYIKKDNEYLFNKELSK